MSAKLDPSKAEEARKALADGDKALKTSLTKWKPDYLEAQPHFVKAGRLFKNAGLTDSAVEAWRKAASCSLKLGNLKQAALTLEDAARDLGAMGGAHKDTAAEFLLESSAHQLEAGDVVRAVDLKMRAGKLYEGFNNDKAASIYDAASALFDGDEDKDVYAADALKRILTHQLGVRRHASAIRTMDRLTKLFLRLNQPHNTHKLVLSRVVLLLADGDAVSAMSEYTRHLDQPGFPESKEAAAAEDLINAYTNMNPDEVKKVAERNVFNFLENPVTRLARGLAANVVTGASSGAAHDGERATKAVAVAAPTVGGFTVIGGSLGTSAAATGGDSFGTSARASEKARKVADSDAATRAALFGGVSRPSQAAPAAAAAVSAAAPAPSAAASEPDYDYEAAFAEMGMLDGAAPGDVGAHDDVPAASASAPAEAPAPAEPPVEEDGDGIL